MREPRDILDKELKALKPDGFIALYFKIHRGIILKLFKNIQTEAFNEAIKLAAEKATATIYDSYMEGDCGDEIDNYSTTVAKESILNLKLNG